MLADQIAKHNFTITSPAKPYEECQLCGLSKSLVHVSLHIENRTNKKKVQNIVLSFHLTEHS